MAIITQRGTVDLIPEYNRALRPIFCISEGDANSRVINLSVTSGGEAFTIPSGAMVYVAGKKQDNNIFVYRCSFTSNTVVFPITDQMSALDGIVMCELQIIVNGNPLGTANFVYWVEPSPIQNGTTSESDLNLFEEAIAKFENFDHFYADVEAMVTEAVANMQIREGQTVIDASLSVSGAAADAKATGDIVRAFMDALVTESTAEAAIATCDDAAGGLPLKKLTANIVPAQAGSGDPSPDNVRPISGYTGVTVTRTGKNILPNMGLASTTANGITYTKNSDGSVTANGTATGTSTYRFATAADRFTLRAGTYRISGITPSSDISITWRATDGTSGFWYDADNEFTLTADKTYEFIALRFQSGAVVSNVTVYPMIRPASITDATYEPYNGATYPITFPTAAGTVYGGALTVNSDGSGTLTVTTEKRTLNGDTSWGGVATDSVSGITRAYSGASYGDIDIIACDSLMVDNAYTAVNHIGKQSAGTRYFITPSYIQGLTSVAEVKAALTEHPIEAVFTLATPTTYALSAVQVATMLNGVNNVWTDAAGTLTTEYYASTGLYVEKKVNAQRNMIAGVEEAMIATKNYAIGDLLIVGNTLYKVTAAVSSGAALVVGTNVTETTVAEQLLALA